MDKLCFSLPADGRLAEHRQPRWKRSLDIVCCALALPFVAPVIGFVAIWMKCTSTGPVLYKQNRVGHMGRTFRCLKIRTMKVGADSAPHRAYLQTLMGSNAPMLKLDGRGDARLIPGGWLLRASGLDELPQVINILRGEMSIVGPRPCIPYEYEQYQPWQKERFAAVPGLTGLWQVSGKNHTSFDEMVRLDVQYAVTKSLWLDLKIILLTGPAVLQQIIEAKHSRGKTAQPELPNAAKWYAAADQAQKNSTFQRAS